MSRNIIVPEPMYDRLKDRKKPFETPTFSAVYQLMLDDIDTQPPENVEKWWVNESVSMKTIRVNNDVYSALWILQDSPENGLSFREITQWLLDETTSCPDEPAAESENVRDDEKSPVLATDGGPSS